MQILANETSNSVGDSVSSVQKEEPKKFRTANRKVWIPKTIVLKKGIMKKLKSRLRVLEANENWNFLTFSNEERERKVTFHPKVKIAIFPRDETIPEESPQSQTNKSFEYVAEEFLKSDDDTFVFK